MSEVLGVDIGGTGIKAAPVDLESGTLLTKRKRIHTPKPATPDAVLSVVKELVDHFSWDGPVGIGVPAVVRRGEILTAANLDKSWIGYDAGAEFAAALERSVDILNDADAAGLAEVKFGVAAGRPGVVMMLTFGTGIGSGLFVDGVLVPNTELGHLELDGHDAEKKAAASARKRDDLSWDEWGERVDAYLRHVEALFSPDLFVIGGGASKRTEKWLDQVDIETEIVAASMENNAGIVGAAMIAPGAEK